MASPKSILNQLGSKMSAILDRLIDLGLDVQGGRDNSSNGSGDEGIFVLRTDSGDQLKMKIVFTSDDQIDVYFKTKSGSPIVRKGIKPEQIDIAIQDASAKLFGKKPKNWKVEQDQTQDPTLRFDTEVKGMPVVSNVMMSIRKSVTRKGTSVQLTNIRASSEIDMVQLHSDIDSILNNDEFIDSLHPNEDLWYSMSCEGDSIDLQPCSTQCETDKRSALVQLRQAAYTVLFNVEYAVWNIKGEDSDMLRSRLSQFTWKLQDQIRSLAELEVECCGNAQYPATIIQSIVTPEWTSVLWDANSVLQYLLPCIERYACMLDIYSGTFDRDIQYQLLCWVREWNHNIRYDFNGVTDREVCMT